MCLTNGFVGHAFPFGVPCLIHLRSKTAADFFDAIIDFQLGLTLIAFFLDSWANRPVVHHLVEDLFLISVTRAADSFGRRRHSFELFQNRAGVFLKLPRAGSHRH
jgi:hypothetical protein